MIALDEKNKLLSEIILSDINVTRLQVSAATDKQKKAELGQFFTEPQLALFMSKMFVQHEPHLKILDPGAGIGVLTSALITYLCNKEVKPISIDVVAVEIDGRLIEYLTHTLEYCKKLCLQNNIDFTYTIVNEDFIKYGVTLLKLNATDKFSTVIMNPPYKKINSKEKTRKILREVSIETTNLYTAFVLVAKKLLKTKGELVAITPRSFCNGTYFKPFRTEFLSDMSFKKIHLFDSRTESFKDDDVLQENIIFHAIKSSEVEKVCISSSTSVEGEVKSHFIDYTKLVQPFDPNQFIRILIDKKDLEVKKTMDRIIHSLQDLNLNVSTGKVVDFRIKATLRTHPVNESVPLIYPAHFCNGAIKWPLFPADKPNAILKNNDTLKLLVPRGNYLLIRRFSPKEEKKRIVAAIYAEKNMQSDYVGFENHVNYFHINGKGLPLDLAKGLAIYLSSSVIDRYFRQFSGHTQVNVGDLKSLPYPSLDELVKIGSKVKDISLNQDKIDFLVSSVIGLELC